MKHTIPYSSIIVTGSISWDIIMDFPNKFVDYLQPDMLHQINVSFVVNTLEKQMGGTGTNISFAVSQAAKLMSNIKSQISNVKSPFEKAQGKQTAKQILGNKYLERHPELDSGSSQRSRNKFGMTNQLVQHDIDIFLLGGIGKDGKEQMKFFKKHGISTDGIVVDKNLYCASGTVITDMKDNQIWGFYYGACTRGKDVDFKRFVKKDSIMIISANHPDAFLKAQQYAIKHNIAYMYDCGMAMSWIQKKDLEQGIKNCRWLVGNDYEIKLICKTIGKTVKDLISMGIEVITTLGEKGVHYEYAIDSAADLLPASAQQASARVGGPLRPRHLSHNTAHIPAYPVKKVVDPTGAGDAWRGGFLAAFCSGADIETCLKIGNVMASFAIELYGTVNYKVNKKEFKKRMREVGD